MSRTLLGLTLLMLLAGCRTVYSTSAPFFYGTFLGHYTTSPRATPVGVRVDAKLSTVEARRYTFTGTATFGKENYTLEGYEETASERSYLAPQAVPPPTSDLFMELRDASGTPAYRLCATLIMEKRFDGPHQYSLYKAEAPAPGGCGSEKPFATVTLGR
jgi:hypothetical protein